VAPVVVVEHPASNKEVITAITFFIALLGKT
jgi:hypothetical protein